DYVADPRFAPLGIAPLRARLPQDVGRARDQRDDDDGDDREGGGVEFLHVDENAFAEPIGEHPPEADPERRADRVEHGEMQPVHAERAGDDAFELPKDDDEAREDDTPAAIAFEERLDALEALMRDADAMAVSHHEMVAAGVANEKAD